MTIIIKKIEENYSKCTCGNYYYYYARQACYFICITYRSVRVKDFDSKRIRKRVLRSSVTLLQTQALISFYWLTERKKKLFTFATFTYSKLERYIYIFGIYHFSRLKVQPKAIPEIRYFFRNLKKIFFKKYLKETNVVFFTI